MFVCLCIHQTFSIEPGKQIFYSTFSIFGSKSQHFFNIWFVPGWPWIIGKRESFQSTFAPTVQIHKLTERSVVQGAEINNLQETMESMQRNTNKTQAEILDRLRALEDQKLTEEEDSNESE